MPNTIINTLSRDSNTLFQRRLFWWSLAFTGAMATVVFLVLLVDFLNIQSQLRAKNVAYGLTDLLIMPYLNILGVAALIAIITWCSRLFHAEQHADFSVALLPHQTKTLALLLGKASFIAMMSLLLLVLTAVPVVITSFWLDLNLPRIVVTLTAQFVLLFVVGWSAAVLSQWLKHSALVLLGVGAYLLVTELSVRLIVDPAWIAPIVRFFSPLSHWSQIATGTINVSNGVFFLGLWLVCLAIAARQFHNRLFILS